MTVQAFDPATWAELLRLVEQDDAAALETWLSGQPGVPPSALSWHDPADPLRRTALMLAYWGGHASAAHAIVNAQADYQQEDAEGHSAAWYARRFGKGQSEAELGHAIRISLRRMQMQDVIDQGDAADPTRPAGKRKRPDL